MTTTEMKTLTCPGPPEHEFQIPKGRGRPPRYCEKHKPNGQQNNGKSQSDDSGEKMSETQTRPRPRPGQKSEGTTEPRPRPRPGQKPDQKPAENVTQLPGIGKSDTGSRGKAEQASRRASAQTDELPIWPVNPKGKPMARLDFAASELVPTGQYANVSIGPARVTLFVDLDREVGEDDPYFEPHERAALVKALNELAESIERDVVALQRDLVMQSMQDQLAAS